MPNVAINFIKKNNNKNTINLTNNSAVRYQNQEVFKIIIAKMIITVNMDIVNILMIMIMTIMNSSISMMINYRTTIITIVIT